MRRAINKPRAVTILAVIIGCVCFGLPTTLAAAAKEVVAGNKDKPNGPTTQPPGISSSASDNKLPATLKDRTICYTADASIGPNIKKVRNASTCGTAMHQTR
eukprot:8439199-Pyramimonas_sp.AAC.3